MSSQGGTLSRIATHTYVFPADVLTQPPDPDGRPATWGTGADAVPADYEMDPGVVGADAEAARTGLEAIPSISIVLEPEDLFGAADGIYMHPAESGDAWERAASAELLLPDVSPGFQIDCGIRIQGGSSTEDWKAAKLSLRLAFRSEYGPQRLVFPLFDGPVASFDSLVLDAHLNFTWVHPDHAQRIRAEYLRDAFTSDLLRAVGAISPHGRFVHLYLGGLYWGLYEVHERPDASFAASYQGGDSSDYDVLRHDGTELVEGTADAWNEMMRLARADLSDPAALDALGAYLDLGAFADYMLVNFWAGNEDWPHHNWYVARRRIPDAGFTFFSWDAEKTLQNVDVDVTGVDDPDGPGEIYQALLASADFRDRVTARAAELFGPGGAFEGDAAQRLYEARVAEIEDAILLESARWGDAERPGEPYTVDDWRAEVEWLRAEWFPARSAIAEGQLP